MAGELVAGNIFDYVTRWEGERDSLFGGGGVTLTDLKACSMADAGPLFTLKPCTRRQLLWLVHSQRIQHCESICHIPSTPFSTTLVRLHTTGQPALQ